MLINLAYKYKLVVSKSQKQLLLNHIFAHNQAWNILLNESNKQFEANKLRVEQSLEPIFLSSVEQDSLVKSILRDRNLKFNTKVVQQTRVNFNKTFKQTIKNIKSKSGDGMLKFKQSRNFNNQSFETTKEQYSILDSTQSKQALLVRKNSKYKILRLFNESFKIRWTRDFPLNSEVSSLTISFKDNHFYVSFHLSYDNNFTDIYSTNRIGFHNNIHSTNGIGLHNPTKSEQARLVRKSIPNDVKSIGMDINIDSIDLGNKLFHKSFNIKDIKLNNLISKNEKKIKRLQRKQARRIILAKKSKIKLGKNFKKTQDKINKIHTKNCNIKIYKLHILTNQIINYMKDNNYNHIIMENLNVKQMTSRDNVNKTIGKNRSKSMKKNILQISFHMFKQILTYKCAMNGVYVSLVDPKNTSKSCSKCGNIDNQLNITKRVYKCKHCGLTLDRDYNACLNILLLAECNKLCL